MDLKESWRKDAAQAMFAGDQLAKVLGITLQAAAPGCAELAMTVTREMTQGHETCHGGAIYVLADTAFGVACNGYNERAVAQTCTITYILPARVGERLLARACERSRRGRSGIYDITVCREDGTVVAEFRGNCRIIGGPLVE